MPLHFQFSSDPGLCKHVRVDLCFSHVSQRKQTKPDMHRLATLLAGQVGDGRRSLSVWMLVSIRVRLGSCVSVCVPGSGFVHAHVGKHVDSVTSLIDTNALDVWRSIVGTWTAGQYHLLRVSAHMTVFQTINPYFLIHLLTFITK